MAGTFKLNHLVHIIKLRKQNCMRVTNLHAHWWAPNPQACYWNVNIDGDGKIAGHDMMDRGKDPLWSLQWIKVGEIYGLIDSQNDGTNYYLGYVHYFLVKVFCVSQMALTYLRHGSQPSLCSSPFEWPT